MSMRLTMLPALLALLAVAFSLLPSTALAKPDNNPARDEFAVRVVSSAPHQVTGGDARLHIEVPRTVPPHQVEVWVNGVDQGRHFALIPGTRTLTGVIDELRLGANAVRVKANGNGNGKGKGRPLPVSMTLTNYPITGPIFSGPHQYPFVCNTESQGLGQPDVDDPNTGTQVLVSAGEIVGYSRDCSVPTQVVFRYRTTDPKVSDYTYAPEYPWKEYLSGMPRPADMATTTTLDGQTVDFIVRWERGTINRFIYSIAMLAPFDDDEWTLNRNAWNKRVIYRFDGGVAIGHTQGKLSTSAALYDVGLADGYAILYSSGTRTGTHYNPQLGGETALMVKERFIERYDVPLYTVGVGGSGGGIQQYLYAQNHPGLIDAAIAQYAYPDMVTQVVHVADCELLEYYMDVLDSANPRWAIWTNRSLLEGLHASDTLTNEYTGDMPGSTECVNAWRGLTPRVFNPLYGQASNQEKFEPQSAIAAIEWTHFADLVNIVGRDHDGYARRYWDNVGVQYGLEAVASGAISPEEFLTLNASIGGWMKAVDMQQEGSPFLPPHTMANFDPWSARNQVFSEDPLNTPAPRTEGSVKAMQAVYRAGLVFMGDIDIPVIDWRNYLEDELDMHNTQQSFAARQRIVNARRHGHVRHGDAGNQVIWFTEPGYDQTPEALAVMDEWMSNILTHPQKGVVPNKPARAVDACFDQHGDVIASGPKVWDGILDRKPPGDCTKRFPIYSTSRRVAGGPFEQSLFKCALVPVRKAISRGFYGVWKPDDAQRILLAKIFPDGVCDYSQPDQGLPSEWRKH
ncbi:MAG TPA: DUF6351 family protein [Candidatus Competibacter sp.]|nr:DUF6351 family protein [Candidatus Competibacter sp.]